MGDYKLVIFDIDGTLVKGNTWELTHRKHGLAKEDAYLQRMYEEGKISYRKWIGLIADLWISRKASRGSISKALKGMRFNKNVRPTITRLMDSYDVAIITNTFDMAAEHVADALGIPRRNVVVNNKMAFGAKGNLRGIRLMDDERKFKLKAFRRLAKRMHAKPEECVMVGDDVTDVPVMRKAGLGIAFEAKNPSVKKAAGLGTDDFADIRRLLCPLIQKKDKKNEK